MEFKDYYQILGVKEDADLKEIKKAYRKLALKLHPDMQPEKNSDDEFKELVEAYEVLKDPQRRAEYDELKKYGTASHDNFQPPPGWQSSNDSNSAHAGGDFSDFFNSVFGGGGFDQRQRSHQPDDFSGFNSQGQDAEIEVPVFLEDLFSEAPKTIQFSMPSLEDGNVKHVNKTLKVKIPTGVVDGERIRLKGQGGKGLGKGRSGDLYLHIRLVPHPLFDVEGHNLVLTVPILPWEAVLGCKVEVPTLAGKINLNIKPNSQTGQKLRVKGKGLKMKTGLGDMIAVLKIVTPDKTTDEDKALWQQLAQLAHDDPRSKWSQKDV